MTTWPDPARPGVPLNPERDGWHWLQSHFDDDPECRFWLPAAPWWNMGGSSWAGPDWVASKFRYLGPCLTRRIPLMDEDDIRAMVRDDMVIMKAATQQEWARKNGISPQYLSDFMTGGKAPGPLILAALGLKRVVMYEAADE